MRSSFVWGLVVAGVVQSGCSRQNPFQRSSELSGEVFIVTRGHESLKLGLVQVEAFRNEEVARALQRTTEKIKDEQRRLRELYEQASALNNDIEHQHRDISEASLTFHGKSLSGFASISDRSSTLETVASMLRSNVEYRQKYLNSAAPLFESLPNSVAAAKTDADGKFKIKCH